MGSQWGQSRCPSSRAKAKQEVLPKATFGMQPRVCPVAGDTDFLGQNPHRPGCSSMRGGSGCSSGKARARWPEEGGRGPLGALRELSPCAVAPFPV